MLLPLFAVQDPSCSVGFRRSLFLNKIWEGQNTVSNMNQKVEVRDSLVRRMFSFPVLINVVIFQDKNFNFNK